MIVENALIHQNEESLFPWKLLAVLILLFLTGFLLALWPIFRSIENITFELVFLHDAFGLVFLLACFITLRKYKDTGYAQAVKRIWEWPISQNLSFLQKISFKGILVCCAITIFSGFVLMLGPLIHKKGLAIFIYLHGTGFLVSLPFLVVYSACFTYTKFIKSRVKESKGKENQLLAPISYGINLTNIEQKDSAKKFLEIFGSILKHSRLRYFFTDSIKTGYYRNVFTDKEAFGFKSTDFQNKQYNAGEYLVSIYRRYFTLLGWLGGWIFPEQYLRDEDIPFLAQEFYSYIPCSISGLLNTTQGNNALMAKYGRYILGEMGIKPAAFELRNKELDRPQNREDIPTEDRLADSVKALEEDLKNTRGVYIPITVEKPDSEFIFFPAVNDYLLQCDTLRAVIVALHALKSTWTLGNNFFDNLTYGSFYGDWLIDRILEKLQVKAKSLKCKMIILGGCTGISLAESSKGVIHVNDFILEAIKEGKIIVNREKWLEKVGYYGFCQGSCYLSETDNSRKILETMCKEIEEINVTENTLLERDEILLKKIKEKELKNIVAPYYNTRERIKRLIRKNDLKVKIFGLYELLEILIQI
jgi:hypothetical protein